MNGSQRREQIVRQIQESKEPVSGKKLAELYGVSRQVIVQDIALIRTAGYDIISTNRGYILNTQKAISRVFKVQHTDEQTEEELYEIVDLGGCVENVMVNHRVYGHRKVFNRRGISSLRCRIGTVFRENVFRRKNRSSKKRPSSTRLYKSVVVVAIIRTSNDNGTELPRGI